jgi:rubrerythrin
MAEFSLNEVIELAIQIEKSGYKFYEQALQRKKLSEPVREVLEKLRNDEIKHEETFKNLRTSEDYEVLGDPIDWQDAASYLRAISDSHVFSQPDAAIKLATEAADEREILENAIQFEKDTLLFFHAIYQKTSNERSKKIINTIIEEEVLHVMTLKDHLNRII